MLVLIVDDDAQIRHLLRAAFEDDGYAVLEAKDGRQALAQIRTNAVNLVITDLVMPDVDGLETLRQLRRSRAGLKIIAISGGSYLDVAAKLGADLVLPKPFEQTQLLEMAKRLLTN